MTARWQDLLKNNFTCAKALADYLELDEEQRRQLLDRPKFILNLPARLAEKIEKGNLDDPILKQFVPLKEELKRPQGYCSDPVGDIDASKTAKLLHKYSGRALLACTSACAMHCRYCFRQNYPYENIKKGFDEELEYIRKDKTLREIILSGGDPLSLANKTLSALLLEIARIPHIRKIRFHTRFPIGIPERIDEEFCALISNSPLQVYIVIHCNHPRELDSDVLASLRLLRKTGTVLLNQSVLLKGVNDDKKTLKELCEALSDNGIIPYYLHQLDRVEGAAHFEVEEEKGLRLIEELRRALPGYAVPKFVKEIPKEPGKTPVMLRSGQPALPQRCV